jgi:hypothetical protein
MINTFSRGDLVKVITRNSMYGTSQEDYALVISTGVNQHILGDFKPSVTILLLTGKSWGKITYRMPHLEFIKVFLKKPLP